MSTRSRGFGLGRRSRRRGHARDAISVELVLEQEPNPESRICLASEVDELGVPLSELAWRFTALDRRSINTAYECFADAARGAGFRPIDSLLSGAQSHTTATGRFHHLGSTRMHEDPRRGVVDANCRVHSVANLYAAGCSVFTTAGFANPTLTLVALAIRLADHLVREAERADVPAAQD